MDKILQEMQCLQVSLIAHGVGGVCLIGEMIGIEIGDQCACPLITALSATVDDAGGAEAGGNQSIKGGDEIIGGPGVGELVDILKGACGLKIVVVDDHAVRGHAEWIFVVDALGVPAGGFNGWTGGDDVRGDGVIPEIRDVKHFACSAPVGHKPLRAFHDDIGHGVAVNGGSNQIVAGGVVKVSHADCNLRVNGIECVNDGADTFLAAPAANGIGPQGNLGFLGKDRSWNEEDEAEKQSDQLFHGNTSYHYFLFVGSPVSCLVNCTPSYVG